MDEEEKMQVELQAAGCKLQEENGGQPLPVPTAPPPPCATRCQGEAYEGSLEEELKEIDKALEDAASQENAPVKAPPGSEAQGGAGSRSETEGVDASARSEAKEENGESGRQPLPPASPVPLPLAGLRPCQGEANGDEALRSHFHSLQEQASKLKEAYPDFDLSKELENPDFLRMTGPEMKIPLEVAYYALHKDDLQNRAMEIAAKATEEKLASAMQSNQGRPQENGSRGQGASINRFDYASMSKAEKKKFLDYAAAAYQRGEKVYLR